jgi:hypothetical protein
MNVDGLRATLDRRAPKSLLLILAAILLTLPAWIMGDALEAFWLKLDDFVYIAEARTMSVTLENLFTPHNAHVVPLFRLLTHSLLRLSGGLSSLPGALGLASYSALAMAQLGVGLLVARETRSPARGLVAMAILGLSTVIEPPVIWYSAGQSLWAGVTALAALLAAQSFRSSGGARSLILATSLAIAAPAVWSGGYVAGPAAAVYLLSDGRPRCRKAAVVLLVAALAYAGIAVAIAGPQMFAVQDIHHRSIGLPERFARGAIHTSQAIPEILVLANLGIDATTTPVQGLVLTLGLAAAWFALKRGAQPSPLEAAGATVVILGFGMAYSFRATFGFDSLRGLGWYQTIPQIGAVLFITGWPPRAGDRPPVDATMREVAEVVSLAIALTLLHLPRAQRVFLAELPPLSEHERSKYPLPSLQRLRGRYLAEERASRQRRFLRRIDRASQLAVEVGVSGDAVRRALGRRIGPGMPEKLAEFDAASLLTPPPVQRADLDPSRLRVLFDEAMTIEPDGSALP